MLAFSGVYMLLLIKKKNKKTFPVSSKNGTNISVLIISTMGSSVITSFAVFLGWWYELRKSKLEFADASLFGNQALAWSLK